MSTCRGFFKVWYIATCVTVLAVILGLGWLLRDKPTADQLDAREYWRGVFRSEFPLNLNQKDSMGRTFVMLAAGEWGSLDFVRLLCVTGGNPNERDNFGRTALSYAAEYGRPDVVDFLATRPGTDLNATDNNGLTTLMWACMKAHPKVIEVLVAKGANLHAKNKQGLTPRDIRRHEVNRYEAALKVLPEKK